jgi:hypothetical protein
VQNEQKINILPSHEIEKVLYPLIWQVPYIYDAEERAEDIFMK